MIVASGHILRLLSLVEKLYDWRLMLKIVFPYGVKYFVSEYPGSLTERLVTNWGTVNIGGGDAFGNLSPMANITVGMIAEVVDAGGRTGFQRYRENGELKNLVCELYLRLGDPTTGLGYGQSPYGTAPYGDPSSTGEGVKIFTGRIADVSVDGANNRINLTIQDQIMTAGNALYPIDFINLTEFPNCPDAYVGRPRPVVLGECHKMTPLLTDRGGRTNLSADIDDAVTTIPVYSTAGFDLASGVIQFDDEQAHYTSKTANSFTVTRTHHSVPKEHDKDTEVVEIISTGVIPYMVGGHVCKDILAVWRLRKQTIAGSSSRLEILSVIAWTWGYNINKRATFIYLDPNAMNIMTQIIPAIYIDYTANSHDVILSFDQASCSSAQWIHEWWIYDFDLYSAASSQSPTGAATTLTADISPSDTVIPVLSTAGFPSYGGIVIKTKSHNEKIDYLGITANSFINCQRGADSSLHNNGDWAVEYTTPPRGVGDRLSFWATGYNSNSQPFAPIGVIDEVYFGYKTGHANERNSTMVVYYKDHLFADLANNWADWRLNWVRFNKYDGSAWQWSDLINAAVAPAMPPIDDTGIFSIIIKPEYPPGWMFENYVFEVGMKVVYYTQAITNKNNIVDVSGLNGSMPDLSTYATYTASYDPTTIETASFTLTMGSSPLHNNPPVSVQLNIKHEGTLGAGAICYLKWGGQQGIQRNIPSSATAIVSTFTITAEIVPLLWSKLNGGEVYIYLQGDVGDVLKIYGVWLSVRYQDPPELETFENLPIIVADVQGYKDQTGEYTGTPDKLIDNPADAVNFILKNFGIKDSEINQESLESARALFDAGSFTVASILSKPDKLDTVLGGLLLEIDSILGHGATGLRLIPRFYSDSVAMQIDESMIIKGSFTIIETTKDQIMNAVVLYGGRTWQDLNGQLKETYQLLGDMENDDDAIISRQLYGNTAPFIQRTDKMVQISEMYLQWIDTLGGIVGLLDQFLKRAYSLQVISFEMDLRGVVIEAGDVIEVAQSLIVGCGGEPSVLRYKQFFVIAPSLTKANAMTENDRVKITAIEMPTEI